MAKIYAKKYQKMVDNGELTLAEAMALVDKEVPSKWASEVKDLLHELN